MSAAGFQHQPEGDQFSEPPTIVSSVKLWLARYLSIEDMMAFLEYERLKREFALSALNLPT